MSNVYITDIAVALPGAPVDNDSIEECLGYINDKPSRAKKIVLKSNGIKSRHYVLNPDNGAISHTNAQLTAEAVKKLETAEFSTAQIQALSCGTTTPDQLMPNHTLMVQGELGLGPIETLSASGICLSGINALKYLYYGIKSQELENGVATGSEVVSPMLHAKNFEKEIERKLEELEKKPSLAFEKDFLRWMLSDGAGAMRLQNRPRAEGVSLKIEWIDLLSYAGSMPTCMYSGCEKHEDHSITPWRFMTQEQQMRKSIFSISQDVKLLNDNIIDYTVEKPIAHIKQKRGLDAQEFDYFLPHYSSAFFRDKVYAGMKKGGLEIPYEKWFTNLTTKGNTGAASIYIMLEELLKSGRLEKGQKLLCYIPESGRFSTAFMCLEVV